MRERELGGGQMRAALRDGAAPSCAAGAVVEIAGHAHQLAGLGLARGIAVAPAALLEDHLIQALGGLLPLVALT